MADKKISQLPKINLISGSEVILPIVHDGTTQKMDVSTFAVFASQWSADTGSNTFIGNQIISGNLTLTGNSVIAGNVEVGGMITAQQYNVTYVSSSVQYKSGSTEFGDSIDDTHTITGTIILNGLALGTPELMAQTASQAAVNLGISSVTGSINTTTSSFNSVFQRISSTTGSINTTTSSFDSVFLGISSVTGALNTFTQSFNSISGSYATTGSNTFRGNQSITGSLSVSAGEFNVTTGSGNMTSSLIFDHTQNDGVTLGLRHNDRLSLADHTFNVNVWAAGVYTTFVRNGTPYSILNVEAFDDNKIYLYRDTRLYNKSLVIDNNLTVQKGIVIGSGSLSIERGQFSAVTGSGALTSSLSFTHTEVDPITGNGTLELRYKNNQVGSENNAWKFVATDNGVQVRYDQYTTSNKMLFSVSSFGSNFDKLLIWRDARLYGTGLTVDDSLLVKGVITGSLLSTNGVVSSSNQLFELNAFTASVIGQTNTIAAFTSSVNFTTQSLNTQTGSQNSLNTSLGLITSSIYGEITSFNSVFQRVSSTTGSMNTQSSSQDLVNYQNSIVTSSFRNEIGGIEAYTASLKSAIVVNGNNVRIIGELTASRIYTEFITSSVLFVTGSNIIGDQSSDKHEFTGSVNINDTLFIKGQAIGTGQLNAFTGSQIGKDFTLSILTSSIDTHILKQATQTGSQDLVNLGISTFTGSQNVINTSVDSHILKQSIQTGSQDLVNLAISTYTGSQNVINSSVNSHILTQATQTGSQDLVNLGISTFTGSLRSEVNLIEAYTASLKAAAIVSSSQQIQNYNLFAQTSSANTVFYGNVTASGNLHANQLYIGGATTASGLFGASEAVVQNELGIQFSDAAGTYMRLIANTANSNTAIVAGAFSGAQPPLDLIAGGVTGISVKNDGGVDFVGSPTASIFKIKTAGGGIDFGINTGGAGKSSQLLDDYEEGTLTGTITCGTSGTVTLDAGYNTLSYTKIGSIVHVFGLLSVTSVSSPVGYFTIPLPFACVNLGDSAGTTVANIVVNGTNTINTSDFVGWIDETQSNVIVRVGNATGVQNTSANELKALTDIYLQVTYRTT